MAFDITKLATDEDKEVNGVWIDYPGGLRLKIARMNNKAFRAESLRRRKEIQQNARFGGDNESEALNAVAIEVAGEFLLRDWQEMRENGELIPYSVESAVRLLTKYPEFMRMVEEAATDLDNYRAQQEGEIRGNSTGSPAGSSSGADTSEN